MNDPRSKEPASASGKPDTSPRFYTVPEYAALTRFSQRTIRMKIASGEIKAEKMFGRHRIPAQTLARPDEGAASADPAGDA